MQITVNRLPKLLNISVVILIKTNRLRLAPLQFNFLSQSIS